MIGERGGKGRERERERERERGREGKKKWTRSGAPRAVKSSPRYRVEK